MKTKAVRLYGQSDLRLEEFELPEIKEDEILARVVSDSICMSSYKAAIQGEKHKRVPEDIAENPVIYGTNASSYTTVHRAIGDTNHTITFTSAGETAPLATFENVDFGSEYDFSSVPTPTVIPDGYDSFKGWVYQDAKGKEREFLLTGRYNVAIANALE